MSRKGTERLADPASHALLTDRDLARRWKKSVRTLQRWRACGLVPRHLLLGAGVYYRLADVLAFEDSRSRCAGSRP